MHFRFGSGAAAVEAEHSIIWTCCKHLSMCFEFRFWLPYLAAGVRTRKYRVVFTAQREKWHFYIHVKINEDNIQLTKSQTSSHFE